MTPFLAIDWGTTNRRVYLVNASGDGQAVSCDDRGVSSLHGNDFSAEVATLRADFGDLPVLCSGMVGSDRGWTVVPYLACPIDITALAHGITWLEPGRTAIVPGALSERGAATDVMRGEEVQLLGAVAAALVPPTALLCQPGTHSKWAQLEGSRLIGFVTAMTGELFSLLRHHSLLAPQMNGAVAADASFHAGVSDSADGELLGRLFGIRADRVSGANRIACPAAYASGLLIGTDVRARIHPGDTVHVLADANLSGLYAAAIAALGAHAIAIDVRAAFIAGMVRIWSLVQ